MPELAYLVIREGANWTDVYRLHPGRRVTIGRAPSNQIVIKDERCSRNHAEVVMVDGRWVIRDLGSRNGTVVGEVRIDGERPLEPGDIIRIAHCQLAFVDTLEHVFPDAAFKLRQAKKGDETVDGGAPLGDSPLLDLDLAPPPPSIIHRRDKTRYLRPAETDEAAAPPLGHAAAKLCQLAFELAKQMDVASAARLVLDGLFDATPVDAGAVLLAPGGSKKLVDPDALRVAASRCNEGAAYHRVSTFLAETVLREGEAVLARNVSEDSALGTKDSQGVIQSSSVICAPIRQDGRVVGLIHLYSTDAERTPTPDDLEFTLAVADNMALALKNLNRQQELAQHLSVSRDEILQLRRALGEQTRLVTASPLMQQVQAEIARAAPSRATVLVRGESGVGKELVARAIHFASPRHQGPFVCINCAALSETLLESELFGHEKGAFTGATERKIGKFEAAHQGTLLLDEIGEMSPAIQAKFLRVLEGHPFERVGGSEPVQVDVRVIAATNRDLEQAVAEGRFRRDLYFRLHVVEIYVPPLRKRPEDIVLLAQHFLERARQETGRKIHGFTEEAIEQLRQYRWPGNVRELRNVVERAVILAQGPYIDASDLTLSNLAAPGDSNPGLAAPARQPFQPLSLAELEKRHIRATLDATGWNKTRTAAILGIERSTLDRKIRRYQLSPRR